MYKIEDYVVYRQLNVCRVEGIETPSFETDRDKKYYKLYPVFENKSNTTIYVPVDSQDGLRPVSGREEVENALKALPALKPTLFTAKKPPQLTAYYQDLLASCDLNKYLYLLKEVALKEKTNAKKLSEIDTRFRNKTERLLCEEFAVVLKETPDDVKARIYKEMKL